MDAVRVIRSGERTLAIFVRKGIAVEGARFFSSANDDLQLGVFVRPAGYRVRAHRHVALPAQPRTGAEFLYLEEGRARVTIFDDAWNAIAEETVAPGDLLLLLDGGHQVEILESARFLEVKQGPYPGDRAKIYRDAP